jgi:hypothetical protein
MRKLVGMLARKGYRPVSRFAWSRRNGRRRQPNWSSLTLTLKIRTTSISSDHESLTESLPTT